MDKSEMRNSSVSKILRKLRISAGYTQQNIADALNINRSTYTYYETGKTTPDIHTLKDLSKMLNVEPSIFFEDDIPSIDDVGKKRPKKSVSESPKTIADLSSEEKSIIAIVRTKDSIDINDIINSLSHK